MIDRHWKTLALSWVLSFTQAPTGFGSTPAEQVNQLIYDHPVQAVSVGRALAESYRDTDIQVYIRILVEVARAEIYQEVSPRRWVEPLIDKHQGKIPLELTLWLKATAAVGLQLENRLLEAIERLDAVIEKARNKDFPKLKGFALLHIGIMYYFQGEVQKTLKASQRAMDVFPNLDHVLHYDILATSAMAFYRAGDHERAIKLLEQSLEFTRPRPYRHLTAILELNLAAFRLEIDPDLALRGYQNAARLANDIEMEIISAGALRGVGKVYMFQEKYELALSYFKQVETIYMKHKLSFRLQRLRTRMALGHVYLKQFKEATKLLSLVDHQYLKDKYIPVYLMWLEAKAKLFKGQGKYKSAYDTYETYNKIYTEWNAKKSDRATSLMRIYFEVEKAELENRELETQNKIKSIRLENEQRAGNLKNWLVGLSSLSLLIAMSLLWKTFKSRELLKSNFELKELIRQKELEQTSLVQQSFIEDKGDQTGFQFSAMYKPAEVIGGDWYGSFISPNGKRVLLLLGDVAGHGMTSAFVSSAVSGAVQSRIALMNLDQEAPETIIENLAFSINVMLEKVQTSHHMTMLFCLFDFNDYRFWCSNAGAIPPTQFRGNTHKTLFCRGTPLGGEFSRPETPVHSWPMEIGDIYGMFTDGLLELEEKSGKRLKIKGFQKMVDAKLSPKENCDLFSRLIEQREKYEGLPDDSTIIFLKVEPLDQALAS
ncbi:SpoIIE family protein phosphatase [Pseudobacteriovorax antillogorgiicola]|uniref:Tetratricopeptide repeat-containing protein n=1 Tax=Pseudobacteriovorax antillogorgiicola TaxID=1513793 RepID=A0A1Y6BVM3_9BACT|nr:SpoIIE family protein phosphatase [Pseudobacteriovorax antillogorgiicola]TCS52260.1 tetratricopeptide repeat protein [Pseudobacteriovorax antillogorgiicola]SMF31002.1 Tetratricopeptide repeat-containing protein [Pseudobacteriovorax antillogorgiicola]